MFIWENIGNELSIRYINVDNFLKLNFGLERFYDEVSV